MEPIELKVGDKAICIPGFKNSDKGGGAGYKEGRIFIIERISKWSPGQDILWPQDGSSGIRSQSVKLYLEEPNYEIY